MADDFFGPASDLAVTTRPSYTPQTARAGGAPTFFRRCTSAGADDGTMIDAEWLNHLIANLDAVRTRAGLTSGDVAPTSADILVESILALIAAALPSTSYLHVGIGGGTANAQTATVVPAISAYEDGHIFEVTPSVTSTSTAPTIAINGLAAKTIVHPDGTALVAGELVAGAKVLLAYDSTRGKMALLGVTKPYLLAQLAALLPANALGYLRNNGSGSLSWRNVQDYVEAATAPASPVNGDEWYDTSATALKKRIAGAWAEIGRGAALLASGTGSYSAGATVATISGIARYSGVRLVATWTGANFSVASGRGLRIECSADAGSTYHRMTDLYVSNGSSVIAGTGYVDIVGLGQTGVARTSTYGSGAARAFGSDPYNGANFFEAGPYTNPNYPAGPFDRMRLKNSANGVGDIAWALYGI